MQRQYSCLISVLTKNSKIQSGISENQLRNEQLLKEARPPMFDIFREFVYGLKLGARHSIDTRHNMTERAISPSLKAAKKNSYVGSEQSGR